MPPWLQQAWESGTYPGQVEDPSMFLDPLSLAPQRLGPGMIAGAAGGIFSKLFGKGAKEGVDLSRRAILKGAAALPLAGEGTVAKALKAVTPTAGEVPLSPRPLFYWGSEITEVGKGLAQVGLRIGKMEQGADRLWVEGISPEGVSHWFGVSPHSGGLGNWADRIAVEAAKRFGLSSKTISPELATQAGKEASKAFDESVMHLYSQRGVSPDFVARYGQDRANALLAIARPEMKHLENAPHMVTGTNWGDFAGATPNFSLTPPEARQILSGKVSIEPFIERSRKDYIASLAENLDIPFEQANALIEKQRASGRSVQGLFQYPATPADLTLSQTVKKSLARNPYAQADPETFMGNFYHDLLDQLDRQSPGFTQSVVSRNRALQQALKEPVPAELPATDYASGGSWQLSPTAPPWLREAWTTKRRVTPLQELLED